MGASLVAALVLFGAAQAATKLDQIIRANDVLALEALAKTAAGDERALADGAALALRHKDAAALAVLEPLARNAADKELRRTAYLAAGGVYLRQGRFAEVQRTSEAAAKVSPLSSEMVQTLDFARALADQKPMTVAKRASGRLAVTRDIAGLARVSVAVNGVAATPVIDSGAGFSTMSESAAKKLGVTLLAKTVTVGSTGNEAVPARLGIAKELTFGDAVLHDVVFIVLPDAALSFSDGKYAIETIIGLPVFEALGRIELAREAGQEAFYYGSKPGAPVLGNMILDGVQPIVLAEAGDAHLRLFVDTGATATSLNGSTLRDYPALLAGAEKTITKLQGAGGIINDADGRKLATLRLTIAGRQFDLQSIAMQSKVLDGHHGDIGQDVLRQGSRWSLDFEHMSFAVTD
jgi:predicted aspartyl protease